MGSGILERFGSHRILRIARQLHIGHGKHIKSKVFIFTENHICARLIPSDTSVQNNSCIPKMLTVHYLCDVKNEINCLSNTNCRLTNDLVAYILKIAVRESCMLLRECQTNDRNKFSQILSSVPVSDQSKVKYIQYCIVLAHSLGTTLIICLKFRFFSIST